MSVHEDDEASDAMDEHEATTVYDVIPGASNLVAEKVGQFKGKWGCVPILVCVIFFSRL